MLRIELRDIRTNEKAGSGRNYEVFVKKNGRPILPKEIDNRGVGQYEYLYGFRIKAMYMKWLGEGSPGCESAWSEKARL